MFKIGDKIVYPMHGAGVIKGIETKDFLGKEKKYYIFEMPIGNLSISIPMNNIDNMNVRNIITKEEGKQVIDILNSKPSEMTSNWSQRYRENQEIIKTGDAFKIAEIVRNLIHYDKEKGLSTTEKKLLNQARRIIASELVMSGAITRQKAEEIIDESTGL
ncbi:MAG: CarD family transcriptional regulator [Tissierellia bacterium]|nr:CarD family transcriptional regulator [Tissierellia bacterium]